MHIAFLTKQKFYHYFLSKYLGSTYDHLKELIFYIKIGKLQGKGLG